MWQALGCKTGILVLQISVLCYHRESLCHPFKLLGCRFQHLWVSCDAFSNCILCPILVSFGCPDLCSIAANVSRLSLCWCVAVCCTLAAASVHSVKKYLAFTTGYDTWERQWIGAKTCQLMYTLGSQINRAWSAGSRQIWAAEARPDLQGWSWKVFQHWSCLWILQDLIDIARNNLVKNRTWLRQLQARAGLTVVSDADDPIYSTCTKVNCPWAL
jgi:hypothetical protein